MLALFAFLMLLSFLLGLAMLAFVFIAIFRLDWSSAGYGGLMAICMAIALFGFTTQFNKLNSTHKLAELDSYRLIKKEFTDRNCKILSYFSHDDKLYYNWDCPDTDNLETSIANPDELNKVTVESN